MINMKKIRAKDGSPLRVRPITENDAPHFVEIFEHMSAESRYRRFLQSLENPSETLIWREAERIAHMDPRQQEGLIAFGKTAAGEEVAAGVARYVALEPGIAEVAVSVRDDMQGKGIGSLLLQILAERARDAGIRTLVGMAQNSNEALWRVLEKLSFPLHRTPEGLYSNIEIDLTREKETSETAVR